jgi:hypothetical protein
MLPSIEISALAAMLNTDVGGVESLIPHYLTRVDGERVDLPPRAAMEWLRQMFLPLPQRPLFKIKEVCLMAEVALPLLRQIMLAYAIPIHRDPALGELISPESFIRLLDGLHGYREPNRFDRAMLIEWMQAAQPESRVRAHLPYSRLLDLEIERIAKLEEPERTVRATELWERYKDARRVSDCLRQVKSDVKQVGLRLQRVVRESIGSIPRDASLYADRERACESSQRENTSSDLSGEPSPDSTPIRTE